MVDSIKEVIDKTLKDLELTNKVKEARVLNLWNEVIGDKIKDHTEAKYINHGTLFVTVDSSTWAHQLLFMKNQFTNKINKRLEAKIVKDIRFNIGKIFRKKNTKENKKEYLDINLDSKEKESLNNIIKSISDKELQDKFYNLILKDKKLKKWKKDNGWHLCSECSTLIAPSNNKCFICQRKEKEINEKEVKDLLFSNPWLKYNEVAFFFSNLLEEDFKRFKDNLLKEIEAKINKLINQFLKEGSGSQKLKVLIQNYVMLKAGVKPNNLNQNLIKELIEKNWAKIYQQL